MIKVILTNKPTYKGYSIEAGFHDGVKHFDHHGEYENETCPANNKNIMAIKEEDAFIEVTHIDTDTLIGLYRLLGFEIPKINLDEVEKIDVNGPSIVYPLNPTLMYMKGISTIVRILRLSNCISIDDTRDITSKVLKMYSYKKSYIIIKGCESAVKSEEYYHESLLKRKDNVAMFYISKNKNIDTGRPYIDGITHMIIYSEGKGSISIFRRPDLDTKFNDKTWNYILFKGHPGACGSPRGITYTKEDAIKVFNEVCEYVEI